MEVANDEGFMELSSSLLKPIQSRLERCRLPMQRTAFPPLSTWTLWFVSRPFFFTVVVDRRKKGKLMPCLTFRCFSWTPTPSEMCQRTHCFTIKASTSPGACLLLFLLHRSLQPYFFLFAYAHFHPYTSPPPTSANLWRQIVQHDKWINTEKPF